MAKKRHATAYDRAYEASPYQKKRRAQRNAARRKMEKAGRVRKGDGKEVDHLDFNTAHNSLSNLKVRSRHANRARKPGKVKYKGKR